ncbi:hypothetical protein SMNI109538_05970 [Smaragdicoccus niigatensis]
MTEAAKVERNPVGDPNSDGLRLATGRHHFKALARVLGLPLLDDLARL